MASEIEIDVSSETALRSILEEIGELTPPVSETQLQAAEAEIGTQFPDLLRRMYLITNGLKHSDQVFFPLDGEGYGSLLGEWREYCEIFEEEDPEILEGESGIGLDAYPVGSVFGDADTYIIKTDGKEAVYKHYPDDGTLGKQFSSVKSWLASLVERERSKESS